MLGIKVLAFIVISAYYGPQDNNIADESVFTFVPQIGHSNYVNSVTITPDGKFIVSGSDDGTIKVWRMSDGALLATLVVNSQGDWAVGAPNGLWDATEGSKQFIWVNRVGTLEVYRPGEPECDALHYPGLLAYIWKHGEVPKK